MSDKPYVFHLGAQAHVGESWHRPYETVMANTIGTLNLLQSIVDWGLELEKFDTAGTSEEYGNVNESVAHHHDFDDAGSLILHERSPINPKSIYATAKVAADFLTMNYHDAFGVPGVVTRMFNNYGPRQNPRYVTGTIITQALTRPQVELGALDPLRDFCFCTDGVRGHLTVAAHGIAGDVYVYGQGENISMARLVRPDPPGRARARLLGRRPRDRDDSRQAPARCHRRDGTPRRLREAARRDGLEAARLLGGRRPADDCLVRGEPRPLDRPCRLAHRRRTRPRRCDNPSTRRARRPRRHPAPARRHRELRVPPALGRRGGRGPRPLCDRGRRFRPRRPGGADGEDLAPLGPLPEDRHFETVLEIGAGYGRIPLYLANQRGTTWSSYYAVDIAENMLRELVRYDEQFGRNRQANLFPICVSADALPLEDDSVDIALSSAVFLHMGKGFVAQAMAEIARTLKPGGHFVFDVSFPNAHNPASFHSRLKPHRLRAPNFMKFWTREEVAALVQQSGLAAKTDAIRVEPASYALLPKRVGPLPIPFARRVNAGLGPSPQRFRDILAASYDAYSTGLIG